MVFTNKYPAVVFIGSIGPCLATTSSPRKRPAPPDTPRGAPVVNGVRLGANLPVVMGNRILRLAPARRTARVPLHPRDPDDPAGCVSLRHFPHVIGGPSKRVTRAEHKGVHKEPLPLPPKGKRGKKQTEEKAVRTPLP